MTIIHVVCVAFHHRNGPIVEYVYPPFPQEEDTTKSENNVQEQEQENNEEPLYKLPVEWKELPFFCLPDGAHQNEEDFVWFHLPPVHKWKDYSSTSFFGISCYRQISSDELLIKTPDITRSTVQKAVLVITQKPVFGSIRDKLDAVTQTYFNQKDFSKTEILNDLYNNLSKQLSRPITDSILYTGTSLKRLVHFFRLKTLILFKLLLLEKRVIFFGSKVERLCTFQYSLISLFPDLIRNLQDVALPSLQFDHTYNEITNDESKKKKMEKFGLPLILFGEGCIFQPYIPLQQINLLSESKTKSYIVGTTNAIFLHHKDCNPDVIVNVDTCTLEFRNKALEHTLSLTSADRKFIDEISKSVENTWDEKNNDIMYDGSDSNIRSQFEFYLFSLLVSMKQLSVYNENNTQQENQELIEKTEKNYLSDYNLDWIREWNETRNYTIWDMKTSPSILDTMIIGHPYKGSSALSGVQISISNTIKDLNLEKKMVPLKQGFSSVLISAESTFSKLVENLKNDEKRVSSPVSEHSEIKEEIKKNGENENKDDTNGESVNNKSEEKKVNANEIIENIQAKSNQFFTNVSSFIKRYHTPVETNAEPNITSEKTEKN